MKILKELNPKSIPVSFFMRDAQIVAQALLGKVIKHHYEGRWLMCRIIETEAYYLKDRASHASLGYTHSRRALFAKPGTMYMYYARGGDSLNFSCLGDGNAVLIKSAYPVLAALKDHSSLEAMQQNNPAPDGSRRPVNKLCSGQTLLCKSMGLKVPEWNNKQMDPRRLHLVDDTYVPASIIRTTRLGINPERDPHLPYRFIDLEYANYCTRNPLRVRNWRINRDYTILKP
ncbi:MAG: DNA-3-methyladenine glycosylase [Candidatus Marinimicrobia bacterium]|nr:DNA-3-methyladenine glycosylase [Candidatus Neomarinimicrobiota bacterium]MCF7850864.1 DNA-3-methyladenine glycosylase [Candidatus Neomarinimicrobiota bacterium]MCF7904379.1 DNA-3-methyladenine glycosylase [Candidatus Neomarinimicrobiota bacterium]